MAAAKKPTSTSTDKKIFDVAKPGKSAPTASSKPIIITNRPILKDPMVVDKSGQDAGTAAALAPSKPSTKIKISPLDEALQAVLKTPTHTDEDEAPAEKSEADTAPDTTPETAEILAEPEVAATPEVTPDQPTDDAAEPVAEATAEPEKAITEPTTEQPADEGTTTPSQTESTPATDEPAKPEAVSTDSSTPATTEGDAQKALSKADEEAARKEAERQAELQKLIESKKFYLPIDRKGKRRTKWHVILGVILILILVVVWVDVALDSGMIHIAGVKPYTHFFSK